MYDYTAQNDDELAFSKGQLINVLNKEDPDWWKGEAGGHVGLFPSNYVKLTTDTDPSQQCKCGARPLRASRSPRAACSDPPGSAGCGPAPPGLRRPVARTSRGCSFLTPRSMSPPPPRPCSFFLSHSGSMLFTCLTHLPSLNLLIVLFCLCVVFLLFLGIICCPSPPQA